MKYELLATTVRIQRLYQTRANESNPFDIRAVDMIDDKKTDSLSVRAGYGKSLSLLPLLLLLLVRG